MIILCPRCESRVAHTTGNLVQAKRGKDTFSTIGQDYSMLVSCPRNCGEIITLLCEDGKLQLEGHKIKDNQITNPRKESQDEQQ